MDQKYNYNVIDIVTTGAVANLCYEYDGELIAYHSGTPEITIRLNSPSEDAIPLKAKQRIEAPFKRFYVTVTAAVSIKLFVSKPKEIKYEGGQIDVDTISSVEKTTSGSYGAVSIGSTWSVLKAANVGRKQLTIQNLGSDIYVGMGYQVVTVANGLKLASGQSMTFTRWLGSVLGIAASGTSDVRFWEDG